MSPTKLSHDVLPKNLIRASDMGVRGIKKRMQESLVNTRSQRAIRLPKQTDGGIHSLPALPKVATSVRESISIDTPVKAFAAHEVHRDDTPNMVNYGLMPVETDSLDQIEVSVRVTRSKPQEKRSRVHRLKPLEGVKKNSQQLVS